MAPSPRPGRGRRPPGRASDWVLAATLAAAGLALMVRALLGLFTGASGAV